MNTKLINQIMVTLRQDRPCKEGLKRILPQRVEGGAIYSALDVFITQAPEDTEDMEFFKKDEVLKATRVTDALLNRIFKPINEFLRESREETKEPDQEEEETKEPEQDTSDIIVDEIMELVGNGKLKKAKKLLKKNKDDLDTEVVKKLKKLIKKGENDG